MFVSHLTIPLDGDIKFVIGRIGVAGFFLISGWLAVISLAKRSRKQFVFNRFLRIYPIYWLLLLMTWVLTDDFETTTLIWNFTLFEQFVGKDLMIGASWMLPIMVVFFLLLLFLKSKERWYFFLYLLVCCGSIGIGALRYFTGRPFPTALCLLMCVGLLGYQYRKCDGNLTKELQRYILLFEIVLIIASWLSYGNGVVRYFIAYNLGFLTFYLFKKYDIHLQFFIRLGELGFTFFLGAHIPMLVLCELYPHAGELHWLVIAITQFILAYALSYVITRWCEKPLLMWGKETEVHL